MGWGAQLLALEWVLALVCQAQLLALEWALALGW